MDSLGQMCENCFLFCTSSLKLAVHTLQDTLEKFEFCKQDTCPSLSEMDLCMTNAPIPQLLFYSN